MALAERMVAEFDSAYGELAQFIDGRSGCLVIAAPPSISAVLLPATVARFAEAYPAVDIVIRDGLFESDAVAGGRADAALHQAGLAIKPLFECAFVATAGNLVAARLGITALPRLTMPLIGAAPLVWRKLTRPLLSRRLGVVTRTGRSLSPAADHFLDAPRRRAEPCAGAGRRGGCRLQAPEPVSRCP